MSTDARQQITLTHLKMHLPLMRPSFAAVAGLAWLHANLVSGIVVNICSTENTGSGFFPSYYALQSNGHCRDTCSGYAFAITQERNCWCSNYAPSSSVDIGSCDDPCPGYPYEYCGSTTGDYGYILIGNPSGIASSPYAASSSPYTPAPQQETIFATETVVNTIVSNNVVIRTTAVVETKVANTQTSKYWSAEVITVSGAVETSIVTTAPTSPADSHVDINAVHSGLSNGAVAGITIGALAGAALVGFLLFCFCWRKRKDDNTDGQQGLNRNTSVLSKVGLLRHSTGGDLGAMAAHGGAATGSGSLASRAPQLDSDVLGIGSGPSSAAGSGAMLERRDSRPLFQDQRLNPNALMIHSDSSRTSMGTLQDDKDYSRPLEVRNPDIT